MIMQPIMKLKDGESAEFVVRVGVYQGLYCLHAVHIRAGSTLKKFRICSSWELFNVDDLVLVDDLALLA